MNKISLVKFVLKTIQMLAGTTSEAYLNTGYITLPSEVCKAYS